MKIGALTIGQAPRDDVTPDFLAALGSGFELIQAGALDGLSRTQIDHLAPERDSGSLLDPARFGESRARRTLVTRLADRSEVILDESKILDLLQRRIEWLETEGAAVIALFCTGEFPDFRTRLPILRPDRLLGHFVASVAQGLAGGGRAPDEAGDTARTHIHVRSSSARILAVIPNPAQSLEVQEKWMRQGLSVEVLALSPYSSTALDVESVALRAAAMRPDLVVLDCIGYSAVVKAVFRRLCAVPVILPRTLLARACAELAL